MPRTATIIINPDVDQPERDQIVTGLVQQFKQYYEKTQEESLRKLAATIENQAFRHAETREQYSQNLTSLSAQELGQAARLHAEINANVTADGLILDTVSGEPLSEGMISGTGISLEGLNFNVGDSHGVGEDGNGCLSRTNIKARQQMARKRIMTRRRRRAQHVGKTDQTYLQPAIPVQSPEVDLGHIATQNCVAVDVNHPPDSGKEASERSQINMEDATIVSEWIDELCNGAQGVGVVGSSFFEEPTTTGIGNDEDCNDVETCFTGSESAESVRKRRRIGEENSE